MASYIWEDKRENEIIKDILNKFDYHYTQEHLLVDFLKKMSKILKDEYHYTLEDFFASDLTSFSDVLECYLQEKNPEEFIEEIMSLKEQQRRSRFTWSILQPDITNPTP